MRGPGAKCQQGRRKAFHWWHVNPCVVILTTPPAVRTGPAGPGRLAGPPGSCSDRGDDSQAGNTPWGTTLAPDGRGAPHCDSRRPSTVDLQPLGLRHGVLCPCGHHGGCAVAERHQAARPGRGHRVGAGQGEPRRAGAGRVQETGGGLHRAPSEARGDAAKAAERDHARADRSPPARAGQADLVEPAQGPPGDVFTPAAPAYVRALLKRLFANSNRRQLREHPGRKHRPGETGRQRAVS